MLDDCKHTARCQSAFDGNIRGNCDSNAARWINGAGKASQGRLTNYVAQGYGPEVTKRRWLPSGRPAVLLCRPPMRPPGTVYEERSTRRALLISRPTVLMMHLS